MTELVFLFDVDNTLLDNDLVKADLEAQIKELVGPAGAANFWSFYEEVRQELDYVDLPRTLERFGGAFPEERQFAHLAERLLCFPFQRYLFPRAVESIAHAKRLGTAAILSDGDLVFQPAKIARAGLADAVDGNVMIFSHKEEHLDAVMQRFPADRYVLVDDKPRVLAGAKGRLGERLVTLHVCQGRYAHAEEHDAYPAPDLQLDAIAEFTGLGTSSFRPKIEC